MEIAGTVQTVLGPVPTDELGPVLSHDHVLCHQPGIDGYTHSGQTISDEEMWNAEITLETIGWIRLNWLSNRRNLALDEYQIALEELRRYADAGGGAIADPTVDGLGRDPVALASLSRQSGLHLIMGCGFYVAETHPPQLRAMPIDAIADRVIADLVEGVADTGIRAGFIGEVGCTWPLQEEERRVLEASVAAQEATGAVLMIHPGRHPRAPLEILEYLRSVGADLTRTIMGHVDRTVTTAAGLTEVAASGCFVSLDVFGLETSMYPFFATGLDMPSDAQRLAKVEHLRDEGFGRQILVSHDICTKHRLARYGGHGYDYLLRFVAPWLMRRGATRDFIDDIFRNNPQRAFALSSGQRSSDRDAPGTAPSHHHLRERGPANAQ